MQTLGPFRLSGAAGRIDIPGRRAQALLAMLAASPSAERTRVWLQDRLWGSRPAEQAQASLRRELSSLRKVVNRDGQELLCADHQRIWINRDLVVIDLHQTGTQAVGEFLEGIDLPGEEGFEDWLREERGRLMAAAPAAPARSQPALADGSLTSLALLEIAGSDEAGDLLAERLARIRWLRLQVGPGSDAARFEIKGQVRPAGAAAPVLSLTLTERHGGRLLWSGRFALAGLSAEAPSTIDEAASAIRARIAQAEQAAAIAADRSDQAGLIWQSQWHMHRMTREDAVRAAELADRASAIDPFAAEAISQAAWVKLWDLWVTRANAEAIGEVRKQAQRAIVADHQDARGHMLAGIAEIWLMQPLRAEALLRRAVELDPSLIMARVQLGCALYLGLKLAEAETELRTALRLSPNDQYLFFIAGELATISLMQQNWDGALVYAETALAARRSYVHGHVAKVNALVRLDRIAEARAALNELYRANPGYSPKFIDWIPFLDSTWNEFLKEGLNRAGPARD